MAIARLVEMPVPHREYVLPATLAATAPPAHVFIHLAWFHDRAGHWLGEWAGYVPEPTIDPRLTGVARQVALDAWAHEAQHGIEPGRSNYVTLDEDWDVNAWNACEPGEAVCVEVSQFGWPVGDHRYHHWDRLNRLIDWPESSVHRYIEVNVETLEVVANQTSHRPVRDAVPGQVVLDVTDTPWAAYHGQIFGRFVRRGDRWGFEPNATRHRWDWRRPIWSLRHAGRPVVTAVRRRQLETVDVMTLPLDERTFARAPVKL